jgi:hypothetical protein
VSPRTLDPDQLAAIEALVRAGRLRRTSADSRRAERFLSQCQDGLDQVNAITSSNIRYNVAYDAAHDVGEAMLAAYGLRTRSGQGQHDAVGELLEIIFNAPPPSLAARHYDEMRTARNDLRYKAHPVGSAQADLAVSSATALLVAAMGRM